MNDAHQENDLNDIIEMIGSMASLDFSKRLAIQESDNPVQVIAYGLNMLSEELEANVIKKTILEQTNANLERFAFTVAHDIKSPLNSAVGLLSLIEIELREQGNDTLKVHVALLQKVCEQIIKMVSGILEYSRTNFEKINVETIDLNKFCNDLAESYSLQRNVSVFFGPDLPRLDYHEVALRQIFTNLINNAIKHNDKEACIVNIHCHEQDMYYEIGIQDNGPGIDHKDQEKIFDLFENMNSGKKESYGIGLSIVKKLVTQANGTVGVESRLGHGAKFHFTIAKRNATP